MVAGISTFLLVIIAMFASVRPFVGRDGWRRFGWLTLGWAFVAVAAFFLVPVLGDDQFGLAQRLFVGVWLAWVVTVAVKTRRATTSSAGTSAPQSSQGRSQLDKAKP
jgi:hypothetical protein